MFDVAVRNDAARVVMAWGGTALTLLLAASVAAQQGVPTASPVPPTLRPAAAQVRHGGVEWQKLVPAHRQALAPLERDWPHLEQQQKLKWIELAQRMPTMPADERLRIQERMADWARMTPVERGQARLRYLQARRTSPDDRGARWEDYQALPTEQKHQLAAKAAPAASAPVSTRKAVAERSARLERADAKGLTEKSNLVTNPNFATPPRAVAAAAIQARPGATTTMVSRQPAPPAHQQIGLPKIAASPGFVDPATLLPQRGPQGAAAVSANAIDPDSEPVPRP